MPHSSHQSSPISGWALVSEPAPSMEQALQLGKKSVGRQLTRYCAKLRNMNPSLNIRYLSLTEKDKTFLHSFLLFTASQKDSTAAQPYLGRFQELG